MQSHSVGSSNGKNPWHAAEREASSAAVKTAVLGYLLGAFRRNEAVNPKRKPEKRWGEGLALKFLLSSLQGAEHIRTLHRLGASRTKGGSLRLEPPIDISKATGGDNGVDLVACPIDGVGALLSGIGSGAIVALVGVPAQGVSVAKMEALHYLTLICQKAAYARVVRALERSQVLVEGQSLANPRVCDKDEIPSVVETITEAILTDRRPSIATSINERDYTQRIIARVLLARACLKAFAGSSISAGIASLFRETGIDAYIGVTRRPHTYILGMAARSSGADVLAIPIEVIGRRDQDHKARLLSNAPVLAGSGRVLGGSSGFLVASGITEGSVLRGVKIIGGDVGVHTLALVSSERSSRFETLRIPLASIGLRVPRDLEELAKHFEECLGCRPREVIDR